MLTRINPHGLKFILSQTVNDHTLITFNGKQITVPHRIDKLNQAWFDWIQRGHMIQVCFSFLKPEEREFLITGITPEEWNKMFQEVDA